MTAVRVHQPSGDTRGDVHKCYHTGRTSTLLLRLAKLLSVLSTRLYRRHTSSLILALPGHVANDRLRSNHRRISIVVRVPVGLGSSLLLGIQLVCELLKLVTIQSRASDGAVAIIRLGTLSLGSASALVNKERMMDVSKRPSSHRDMSPAYRVSS